MSTYVAITSQYYFSRYSVVCEFVPETFRKQAMAMIEGLEKYKRTPENSKPIYYGDLADKM